MIVSIYQLDFIAAANGSVTNLLAIGDDIEREIEWPMQNKTETFSPIGARWGKGRSLGGARTVISFGHYMEHASHAAAAAYCLTRPTLLPILAPGKIRVTISDSTPMVFDMLDAVIIAAIAIASPVGEFASYTTYRLEAGKLVPVSGLTYFAGMPHSWILTAAGSLSSTLAANHAAA